MIHAENNAVRSSQRNNKWKEPTRTAFQWHRRGGLNHATSCHRADILCSHACFCFYSYSSWQMRERKLSQSTKKWLANGICPVLEDEAWHGFWIPGVIIWPAPSSKGLFANTCDKWALAMCWQDRHQEGVTLDASSDWSRLWNCIQWT